MPWVDCARGFAVFAVVVFHVVTWLYAPLFADVAGSGPAAVAGAVQKLNGAVSSLRMPVLFTLSGFLASRRIAAGWLAIRRPCLTNAWLYALWLGVFAATTWFLDPRVPHHVDGLTGLVHQFMIPETPLWYLAGLVLDTCVLTALRRAPSGVVIALLAVLAVVMTLGGFSDELGFWEKILHNTVFFAVGARGGGWLVRLAALGVPSTFGLTLFGAVVLWADRFFAGWGYPVWSLVRSAVMVASAIALSAAVARLRPFAWFAKRVGRRTLDVYVIHLPLLLILTSSALTAPQAWAWVSAGTVGAAVFPVAVAALLICLAILAGAVLWRRAPWALRLPQWLDGLVPDPLAPHRGMAGVL